jgi:large subunit ribosomal protein L9
MKVILKDNIEYLGKKGDIVKVAPGYGRNYLLPKKLALEVTATNMKMIEMVQKSLRKGLEKEMKVYQSLIEKLNAVNLTFPRKAGEKDAIFGSVSVTDIRDALAELSFEVEKKRILLDEPIKRLGNYTVPIKVFQDDRALIKLEVIREGGPGEGEPTEPEAGETPLAPEAEPVFEDAAAAAKAEIVPEPAPAAEAKPEEPEAMTDIPAAGEAQPENSVPEALEEEEREKAIPALEPTAEPAVEAEEPGPVINEPEAEAEEPEAETEEPEAEAEETEAESAEPEKTPDTPAEGSSPEPPTESKDTEKTP